MLKEKNILIVEDDPLIALCLAVDVEDACGRVIGPAGTIKEAFKLIGDNRIDGAIVDVNLPDGLITPIANLLLDRSVSVVFHTSSTLPEEVNPFKREIVVCSKPNKSESVIGRLDELLDNRGRTII